MANRLAEATSPYLLQHADNPVDWWEWGSAAFDEARRRGVPVLLSVGYAACHWCHVMAHESFEDEATAAYLNEHFVAIKVDREERPDVDAVYMAATTAMTGQGGWPMTCVLDHDGNPFFAGTYFPDQPRHGQPSFRQLLTALTQAWRDAPDDVRRTAERVRAHLQTSPMADPAQPQKGSTAQDSTSLASAVEVLAGEFDPIHGGFGGAPKFPPSMVLGFLIRHAQATGSAPARQIVSQTVTAMARGGIHDQLAGGFARYSVDAGWVVPHFEKMLYDNAQLLSVYARWSVQAEDAFAADVARGVAGFLLAELGTAEGGFASALDADSEGVEGAFYVWSPAQLIEVLGADGAWAADLLQVTERGTFEEGTSTLQLLRPPPDEARWESVRRRLLAARGQRPRPARDDKVVAAWNALAICGLVEAGQLLDEPEWVAAGVRCAELLFDVHLQDGRLRRVSRDGQVGSPAGVLEDYGCLASACIALACATGEARWLDRAGGLLDTTLAHFSAEDGGFFDTADDAEELVARPREFGDNASPAGVSATVHALLGYAALTGSGRHRAAAERALGTVRVLAERAPRFAGWSLAAAQTALRGPVEVAVVGPDDVTRAELADAARRHAPSGSVVVVAEPGTQGIPLLEGRNLVAGQATAYVCADLVCRRPVTEVEQLVAQLSAAGTSLPTRPRSDMRTPQS
ncbi:MAG: thioredoxin domain-containing protein [Actinomycetota bacterium]|nr:thioredoxin domain-containing protein [Actinomycetota bacterium]